jgi:predicted dehydrogenase
VILCQRSAIVPDTHAAARLVNQPFLSVVLVAVAGYDIIQRTVNHLRRQTIADRIELLVMSPDPERIAFPPDVAADFYDVRIVDIGTQRHLGAVRAEGIRQARAAYVAISEDHCFPNDVWAELIVAEHDAGADVVGPRIVNCNPGTATSWSAYLIAYAPWICGDEPQAMNVLPGHNSSYRRAAMLPFGRELDLLMSSEVIAHWALYDRGAKLVWQPQACCRHVNVTRAWSLAASMFHHGRNFGAARTPYMSTGRRWIHVLAAPLVPAVRVYRAWPMLAANIPPHISRTKVLCDFALAAIASTAGETLGMALGAGRSPLRDWYSELDRRKFIHEQDYHFLSAATPAGNNESLGRANVERAEPVRIGVIGCGALACGVHLPLLARRNDVVLVALADYAAAARDAASRFAPAARLYDQGIDLVHDHRVEAVLICTPAWLHADLAVDALQAGKHLYLEKPLATTLSDGERIVATWRAAGTAAMIGFNYRQHPGYVAIRNAVVHGEIGNIVSLRVTFCTPRLQTSGWRGNRQQGGGVLLELASHEIDLIQFVLGESIVELSAQVSSRESEDDTAHLQGRTASGVGVLGFFSFGAVEEAGMEVYGDAGKLLLDRYGRLTVARRGVAAPGPVKNLLTSLLDFRGLGYMFRRQRSPWREPSFEQALARFVHAVRTGTPVSPDLNDGLQSLRVIAAAEMAARCGTIERIAEPEMPLARRRVPLNFTAEVAPNV